MIKFSISNFRRLIRSNIAIKLIIFTCLFASLFFLFLLNAAPQKYKLTAGDISNEDIYAPSDLVDKVATELARKQAEEGVVPVYKLDLTVQIDIEKKIDSFFNLIEGVKANEALEKEQKLQAIERESVISLNNSLYSTLLNASSTDIKSLRDNIQYIINQILNERITEAQLNDKRGAIREFFMNLPKKSKLNEIGADIAVMTLRPNMYYDEQTTLDKRQLARDKVEEVIIKKNTQIVTKGREVTEQQIQLLKSYGLLYGSTGVSFDVQIYTGYSIIIGVCLFVMGLYLKRSDKKLWNNGSSIFLISLIIVISIIISVAAKNISNYLILLPTGTMLISVLINPRVAVLSNIIMSVLVGFMGGFDLPVMAIMLLMGILGAELVSHTHHRSTFILTGLAISLASMLIIMSVGFITRVETQRMLFDMFYGMVGGILSAILTIGTLPFFESTFDIITPIKLLELSNPNQPLLRRLLIEAPGTYYHSILVGNLAESAAEDVGANALLCRVGAYYHDIGKLKRPYFFKENQLTKDNPHDKITPNLSALIITSHVKDGVETAKKSKLPSSVIRIIEQHHGNTLVSYFYHKALNSENSDSVEEDKFRYAFKKPQTKEAAIVMLADSVEAYIRSLTEPSQEQVEQGVRKIIKDKLNDTQLDHCDLTLKDLEKIAQSFVKVLAGIFHDRIEYPENIKDI